MSELRVGVVGCGRAAEDFHLPAIRHISGLRVTALADPDAETRSRALRLAPGAHCLANGLDLARDPEVDVVAVCVPPSLHTEVAVAALAAGKHVYLEKPLAVTLDDAERIRGAARRSAARLALGFNLRSHRLVLAARDVIAAGRIGPIGMLRTAWTCTVPLGRGWPAWRLDRALGGGAFFEIAVHHLDLARFLLDDEIRAVTAVTRSGEVADQDILISALMRSGVALGIHVSQGTVAGNDIEAFGRLGAVSFSCYRADSLDVRSAGETGAGARFRGRLTRLRGLPAVVAAARGGGDFRRSFVEHWRRFAAAIRGGGAVPASLDDGERALAAVLAAIRSADTGERVRLSGEGPS